jgi:hypothetical protein
MKIIEWHLSIGYPMADRDGEIEVEDSMFDEEIDALVRQEVFNFVDWGWTAKPAHTDDE